MQNFLSNGATFWEFVVFLRIELFLLLFDPNNVLFCSSLYAVDLMIYAISVISYAVKLLQTSKEKKKKRVKKKKRATWRSSGREPICIVKD